MHQEPAAPCLSKGLRIQLTAVACLAAALLTGISAQTAALPQPPAQAAAPPVSDKPLDPIVRELLQQYATALESLDAEAVKKVQPSIDVEGLKRAFREMRALEVDIDNIRVLSGDTAAARVSCRVAQTLTPKAGSRHTTSVTRVLRVQRQDTGWIIQSFER